AGGRLSEEYIKYFFNLSKEKGFNFFVMYGQTEATARISYVPCEKLETKIGSIGIPIPEGRIELRKNSVDDDSGELVYHGKNVMLGYASNREDLSNDDELKGQLLTGDLARVDEDGFYYITGRTKRFLKIFGLRLNLDEVEKLIENQFQLPNACFGSDDKITVLVEVQDLKSTELIKNKLIEIYKLHHSVIEIKQISQIPVTSSGKKDYAKIKEVLNLVSD
nr:AMP-binding protein [Ignavibacteriaceae bacterium]